MRSNSLCRAAHRTIETLERRSMFAAFGTPDADFGIDGHAVATAAGSFAGIEEMVVLADGRIIAAGDAGLVRFSADGIGDSNFGTRGRAKITGLNFADTAVGPSNHIYIVGGASVGTVILRLTPNGKTDASFGIGGSILVTASHFGAQQIAIDSEGKIFVAGTIQSDEGQGAKVRVYRLNADGSPDNSFDSDGAAEFDFAAGTILTPVVHNRVTSLHVLPNGQVMVAGGGLAFAPERYDGVYFPAVYGDAVHAVARLDSSGALDDGFGSGGISREIMIEEPGYDVRDTMVAASAIASDSGVFIAGRNLTNVIVTKFNSAGAVVFTSELKESIDFGTPDDVVALPDGRAALIGRAPFNSERLAALTVDRAGEFGNVVFPVRTTSYASACAAVQPNTGNLLLGGSAIETGNYAVTSVFGGNVSDSRPDEFADARANDIVQDNLGRLHLAYYDARTTTLKYAMRDENGLWSAVTTIDANANAGQYLSLATDSKNNPAIAYFDGTNGDLKLATFSGRDWTIRSVDTKGSVGLYPSLAFDASDRPSISYYRKTSGDLRFAKFEPTTGSFKIEVVDSEGDVGRSSMLVLSPKTERFTIAYANITTGDVMWAGRTKSGKGWSTKVAAATTGGADFISMAYGYYYEPAISYYDAAKADLKLTYFDTYQQKFIGKTLATKGAVGLYSQVMFNYSYGQPIVLAYDRSQDRITRFNETIDVPASQNIFTGAGRYLSADYSENTGRIVVAAYNAATGKVQVRSANSA